MPASQDPYRTLGLGRDATTDEIRRAYRRLAKANHPDSAGEAALPRFLAIQAAYEELIGPVAWRPRAGRSSSARSPAGRDAWRADPDGARTTHEANERRAGRRPGARPGGSGRPGPGAGPAGAAGTGAASTGATGGRSGAGTRRRGERKRPANKATLGSTTYDTAEDEPFEPEWSGGTWYGASSGTYWTINPKEYADPRKHGPEYQRRARRRVDGMPDIDPTPAGEGAGGAPPSAGTWSAPAGDPADQAPPEGVRSASEPAPAPAEGSPSGALRAAHLTLPGGFAGRVAIALLGWPPLGVALATIAGEMTGCSRFAAGCVELFGVGTWLAQLAIIALLLALPAVAAASAFGTLAALAAAVPTAVFLSATGGSREPEAAAAILAAVLAVAYVAGVVVAIVRRGRWRRVP
jgi:hypothetical protein